MVGPVGVMAGRLKALLAESEVDVAWHRHAGGLLREPVADAIVVDGVDPVDATAAVRRGTAAPLIVIGAEEQAAVTCLAMGADALLPSGTPLSLIAAQVRAVLRRRAPERGTGDIEAGLLRMDVAARRVMVDGDEVLLKPREFDLLRVLLESKGVVLTRDRILAGAWGSRFVGEPKTVDVHIAWLRPKIERSGLRITTLRGVGYRLDVLDDRTARVLFVCVQNAGRSQMAAALFNRYAEGRASAISAGTRPAKQVHREVVDVMREVGIDLQSATPALMTADLVLGATRVITMGCGDECPVMNVPQEDWGLPDPAGLPLPVVREIRDEIDARVRALLARLEVEAAVRRSSRRSSR